MKKHEEKFSFAENDMAGARARTKRIARRGPPRLAKDSELTDHERCAAQYRAATALMWDEPRILAETRWSRDKLEEVKQFVAAQDRDIHKRSDPEEIFALYEARQLQVAKELEDLAEVFRSSRQFGALVNALKVRADVFDRIVRMSQELGLVRKAPEKIEVNSKVNLDNLSIDELRVYIRKEYEEIQELLKP